MKWRLSRSELVKGTRGAISIFLIIVILPFISIAALLIEINRFNSAVAILDELMSISSVATLGNYDNFVRNRFGLLSISQDRPVDAIYDKYFGINSGILGKSFTFEDNSLDVKGDFPLSDEQILMSQILEFSTVNAPATMITRGLSLEYWVGKLEGLANVDKLLDSMSAIAEGATQLDKMEQIPEKFLEFEENFKADKEQYEKTFKDLDTAVKAYAGALKDPPPTNATELQNYTNDLNTKRNTVVSARTAYLSALQRVRSRYNSYLNFLNESSAAINGFIGNVGAVTGIDPVKNAANGVKDHYNSAFAAFNADTIRPYIEAFSGLITMVDNHLPVPPTGTFFIPDNNERHCSDCGTGTYKDGLPASLFHSATVGGYATEANVRQLAAAQEAMVEDGELEAFITSLANTINKLFATETLFGRGLDAYIDTSILPGGNEADNVFVKTLLNGLNEIKDCINDVLNSFSSANEKKSGGIIRKAIDLVVGFIKAIYNVLKLIYTLIKVFIKLIIAILKELRTRFVNLLQLFQSYERAYLANYSVYNMPSRVDHSVLAASTSFQPLTGAEMGSWSYRERPSPISNIPLLGEVMGLINTGRGMFGGQNQKTFYGADVEYILYGTRSEVVNQVFTLVDLYLLRFLVDAIPVLWLTQQDPALLAAQAFTFGLSTLAVMFLEPLADCYVLVNGGNVSMVKTTLYISVKGIGNLVSEAINIDKISELLKLGTTSLEILPFSYKDHCFLLMCIVPTKEQMLARIQNIVQMESSFYYNMRDGTYGFDLEQAYTFIGTEVNAKVNNFLPVPEVLRSSFRVTRSMMRGY